MQRTCENVRALQWVLTERKRVCHGAIKRKFGVRVRQTAEIDSIVRYEFEGYM